MAAAWQTPAPHQFCIGIDFGTTFSGASIRPGNGEPGVSIMHWPSEQPANNVYRVKAPTRLSLHQPAKEVGRWGFEVSDEEDSFQWFKLGLMHPDDLGDLFDDRFGCWPIQLKVAETLQHINHVRVADLVKTYLQHLWAHILGEIVSTFGVQDEQVSELELHVVIGIPANWNRAAVARLRDAAQEAGVPGYGNRSSSLRFCTEPEAATMALVEHHHVSPDLARGDIITVCDCGGGTADAVSYLIASTQPFRLEECVPGKARFCGPVLLDSSFRSLLEQKIKTVAAPNTLAQESIQDLYLSLWERGIKPSFDGPETQVLRRIAVTRGGERANLRAGSRELAFTGGELQELFDPTVRKIKELLHAQVVDVIQSCNKLPKSVIICGGFSASPYLQKRLSEEIDSLNQEYASDQRPGAIRFEVAQPIPSRQAVAIGCAMQAFAEHCQIGTRPRPIWVASRVARATYGVRSTQGFRQLVTKGDSLPLEPPMRFRLHLDDFSRQRPAASAIGLDIFQGQGARIEPDSVTKACEMAWTDGGAEALSHALQGSALVELAIVSVGEAVDFTLYIDGVQQRPGDGFALEYAMR